MIIALICLALFTYLRSDIYLVAKEREVHLNALTILPLYCSESYFCCFTTVCEEFSGPRLPSYILFTLQSSRLLQYVAS